jgi:hypothetical protein
MRQNTVATKALRNGISDPLHTPVAILTELAIQGTSSFIEAQKILLNLAQQENDIMMNGIRERITGSTPAVAMTELVRRSLDTFIRMQEDFLKTTSKQIVHWLEAVKAGKGYEGTHLVDLAREEMETFVQAQRKFLDVIAQETVRATSGKHDQHARKVKKTELSELAREATNSFIDAQKRLLDVVSQQMHVNLKAATRTMELASPSRLMPMANLTGEGVRNFVGAEKTLIDSMIKRRKGPKAEHGLRHTAHQRKAVKVRAAHAGA